MEGKLYSDSNSVNSLQGQISKRHADDVWIAISRQVKLYALAVWTFLAFAIFILP